MATLTQMDAPTTPHNLTIDELIQRPDLPPMTLCGGAMPVYDVELKLSDWVSN